MHRKRYCFLVLALAALTASLVTTGSARASDLLSALHGFCASSEGSCVSDGNTPIGLTFDSKGNIFGAASAGGSFAPSCLHVTGCGVIFELSPASGGGWTFQVIYTFTGGADGGEPQGPLAIDPKGNIYGTAFIGGNTVNSNCLGGCGTVFELSPSADGWTFTTLHSFDWHDGANPNGGLIRDKAGNLYGTIFQGGDGSNGGVFELSPSAGTWTLTTLYAFSNMADGYKPYTGLAMDRSGNLYGTTGEGGNTSDDCSGLDGCGTVFELSPSAGTWTFSLLYAFQGVSQGDGSGPYGALILDSKGDLFGTTYEGGSSCTSCEGTVFKLSRWSGSWREQILHRFSGPDGEYPVGALTMDAGNLYGTTSVGGTVCSQCGTVFTLHSKGTAWQFASLYSFTYGADGALPLSGVLLGTSGRLYGTAASAGTFGGGTVFELSPQ